MKLFDKITKNAVKATVEEIKESLPPVDGKMVGIFAGGLAVGYLLGSKTSRKVNLVVRVTSILRK